MRKIAGKVLSLATLFIGAAILAGVIQGRPEDQFGEGRVLTFVSGLLLLGVAWITFQVRRLRHVAPGHSFWKPETAIWGLIALGFVFLAVDEVAQVHEKIDKGIHLILGLEETHLTDRLDDLIIALFGLIGLAALVVYRKELMRQRQALPYLGAAGILFVLMVVIDVLTNKQDILARFFGQQNAHSLQEWLAVAEDSFKLYAEAFFFLAFYSVLHKTRAESAQEKQESGK